MKHSVLKTSWSGIKLVFFISTFIISISSFAQESKEITLQKAIQSKHYIFKAQSALPMRGGMRQLTSEYDLKVEGDTLTAYLPYFGRAYIAPIDPGKGGIQFTSGENNYNSRIKKNSWEITILPKNIQEVRQLFLTIAPNGNARLQVISNNRDPISFNGYVEAIKNTLN
jgi:hypothetical protein